MFINILQRYAIYFIIQTFFWNKFYSEIHLILLNIYYLYIAYIMSI